MSPPRTLAELRQFHVGEAERFNEAAIYWTQLSPFRIQALGPVFHADMLRRSIAAAEFHIACAKLLDFAHDRRSPPFSYSRGEFFN